MPKIHGARSRRIGVTQQWREHEGLDKLLGPEGFQYIPSRCAHYGIPDGDTNQWRNSKTVASHTLGLLKLAVGTYVWLQVRATSRRQRIHV